MLIHKIKPGLIQVLSFSRWNLTKITLHSTLLINTSPSVPASLNVGTVRTYFHFSIDAILVNLVFSNSLCYNIIPLLLIITGVNSKNRTNNS